MTDSALPSHEALAAALDHLPAISGNATDRHSIPADRLLILAGASRERLTQLPETCGTCGGRGWAWSDDRPNYGEQRTCPTCRGRGTVYSAALVERLSKLLPHTAELYAVLDALNTEPA